MTATAPRPHSPRIAAGVWAILVLCTLPELVLTGADLGLWGARQWRLLTYQHAAFWAGLLSDWRPHYAGQPWLMFVTYGFLHAGLVHLGVNMAALLSLSRPLVARLGQRRFLVLYALSLLGGGAGFATLGAPDAPMIGASGAVFGLVGAYLALDVQRRSRAGATLRPVARALALLFVLNVVLWWALHGQLAWETHLGGFLAGWAYALVARRR